MNNLMCIYHGSCLDGIGSAWAFDRANRDAGIRFYAGKYSEPPPDVEGMDVYIVDFSYKRPILESMAKSANSITVIDHHKTAEDDLSEPIQGIKTVFDMGYSGCMLTWMYFNNGRTEESFPFSLRLIQDRDLWKFEYEETKEFNAALFSYNTSDLIEMFEILDECESESGPRVAELIAEGKTLLRDHNNRVKSAMKSAWRGPCAGIDVPWVNAPPDLASDLGHLLGEGEEFAVVYWDTKDKTIYSLRSPKNGADVSKIAKIYGGGGHKHASGFTKARGDEETHEAAK